MTASALLGRPRRGAARLMWIRVWRTITDRMNREDIRMRIPDADMMVCTNRPYMMRDMILEQDMMGWRRMVMDMVAFMIFKVMVGMALKSTDFARPRIISLRKH